MFFELFAKVGIYQSLGPASCMCDRDRRWAQTACLLRDMLAYWMKPDVISYRAAISACSKGQQWEPGWIKYNATISAYEKGLNWVLGLGLVVSDVALTPARR